MFFLDWDENETRLRLGEGKGMPTRDSALVDVPTKVTRSTVNWPGSKVTIPWTRQQNLIELNRT